MSIYATLWSMWFPKDGWGAESPEKCVEVYAQAVPSHIKHVGPNWEWLPPPVRHPRAWNVVPTPRAVFICGPRTTQGTERNGQEYVNPLLVLTGKEYERIRWVDLWDRIERALMEQKS